MKKETLKDISHEAVVTYLKKHAFSILERNYIKKWGELDIVAWKDDCLHFVTVKSLSEQAKKINVTPEEYIYPRKLQRIARTIQTYLDEKNVPEIIEWQFDIANVLVDTEKRLCKVSMLNDLVV